MTVGEAWIIDAVRSPRGIGKQGKGALSHLHPQHLGSTVLKALAERNDFDTADVDDVVWGTSSQVSASARAVLRSSFTQARKRSTYAASAVVGAPQSWLARRKRSSAVAAASSPSQLKFRLLR